jgi:hypothetical protein
MRLFRVKTGFVIGETNSLSQTKIFKGQLFAVGDETELPDPRPDASHDGARGAPRVGSHLGEKYPGNLKPFYEEIVPNAFLVKQFTQVAKVKEL